MGGTLCCGTLLGYGLLLGLGDERGDFRAQAGRVAAVIAFGAGELVGVVLLVGKQLLLGGALLLQLGFFCFEFGLERLDVVDGLGVGVVNLVGVVQTAHEILEVGRVKEDLEQVGGTGPVASAQARGEDILSLEQLGLLLGDGRLKFGDLVIGLLQIGLALCQVVLGDLELFGDALQLGHSRFILGLGARERRKGGVGCGLSATGCEGASHEACSTCHDGNLAEVAPGELSCFCIVCDHDTSLLVFVR